MLQNHLLPHNSKTPVEQNYVLGALILLLLLEAAYSELSPGLENTGLNILVFVVAGVLGLAIQYRLYRKGGWLPNKDGKPSIHSSIIFYATLVAVAFMATLVVCLLYMLS